MAHFKPVTIRAVMFDVRRQRERLDDQEGILGAAANTTTRTGRIGKMAAASFPLRSRGWVQLGFSPFLTIFVFFVFLSRFSPRSLFFNTSLPESTLSRRRACRCLFSGDDQGPGTGGCRAFPEAFTASDTGRHVPLPPGGRANTPNGRHCMTPCGGRLCGITLDRGLWR